LIHLSLTTHFSCAHFYAQDQWTEAENRQVFGKCFSTYGHGHDYQLKVTIITTPDDLKNNENRLAAALRKIHNHFDHRHLNFDFEEFKILVPTTENFSKVILSEISHLDPELKIHQLSLFETPDLFVEIDLN